MISNNKDKIIAVLQELGKTPKEIYQALRTAGITGNMSMCSCCPIHNYLEKKGLLPGKPSDDSDDCVGWFNLIFPYDRMEDGTTKGLEAVGEFISNFDDKLYPDLISVEDKVKHRKT
jgi:hypothetical protein